MSLGNTFARAASPVARRYLPLFAVSALSAGCLSSLSDEKPDDSRSEFHDITVKWHIRNVDNTVMASCPPGFTTLITHLYRAGYAEPPDALVSTPCTAEGSLTKSVATAGDLIDETTRQNSIHGYYDYSPQKDIWIDVTEETQSAKAAVSFTYYIEKLTSDTTIDFDLYPNGGVGLAVWSLSSSASSAPLTSCATAGVDEIEYAARLYSDDTAPLVVGGSWPCDAVDPFFYYDPDGNSTTLGHDYKLGSGHTRAYAPESYYVELRAKRAGVVVGTSMGSLAAGRKNTAHQIIGADIPINDR